MAGLLDPQDIVDFSVGLPDGWHDMPFPDEPEADAWPQTLAESFGQGSEITGTLSTMLRAIQGIIADEDPDGATQARVYVPFPQTGIVNGYMTTQFVLLEPGDTPESYLAEVDSHANDRYRGYEVRGYQSWRSAHPLGESVGFTHLAVLGDDDDSPGVVEQRVVLAVFPVGAKQLVQLVFRSAFIGGFDDLVTEAQAIVDTLTVSLGAPA